MSPRYNPNPTRRSFAGLGPDIYGAVDFRLLSVLKGGSESDLRIVYKSGKRDGYDTTK